MGTRTRNRIRAGQPGTVQIELPSISYASSRDCIASRDYCQDFVPGPDQALLVAHEYSAGHVLTLRHYPDPSKLSEFIALNNYPLGYFADGFGPGHQTIAGRPNVTTLAIKLLAATSPSKPVVDLPVSFLELRELPHLLKTVGDSLIKTWAKKNLNREFGLEPMMADALALLKFSKSVADRVKLYKALREKPQLRKATLWKGSVVTQPGNLVPTNTSPAYVNVYHKCVSISTTTEIWGYVRWKADSVFNKGNLAYTDPALEYLARRAVTGTQLGLVTAWNALPWSWLFDWFSDMGTWLEANRSVVPCQPSIPRICTTTKTSALYVLESSSIGLPKGSTPITNVTVSKGRTIASASLPSAFLPLFTGRQINILASLAALRTK